ncbi:MAG: gas vesicle protein K [Actinomycetes bacterium]
MTALPGDAARTVWRVDADPEDIGQGLARLVLALLEIVRELLERQAVRRVEAGSLTPEEVERLGRALISLKDGLAALREHFAVSPHDDLDLPRDLLDSLVEGEPSPDMDPARKEA